MEPHSVSRIIGSPPGYVGIERTARRHGSPWSVVFSSGGALGYTSPVLLQWRRCHTGRQRICLKEHTIFEAGSSVASLLFMPTIVVSENHLGFMALLSEYQILVSNIISFTRRKLQTIIFYFCQKLHPV